MPPDELAAIFEPFYRGKNSSGQTGYGLGRAIANRVVQTHGGTVSAANRSEGGLVMTIVLPVADTAAALSYR